MKLKAIEKICKATKTVFIWTTDDGRKFIGDGSAFYLLPDGLAMPAAGMLDVFDVALDKRGDWTTADHAVDCRGQELFADVGEAEEAAEPIELTLGINGEVLRPVGNAFQTILVNEAYFKPLEDERQTLRFFLRRNLAGTPYVAVKAGLLLRAMFTPVRLGAKLCGMVSDTAARLERTREEYRGGNEDETGQSF